MEVFVHRRNLDVGDVLSLLEAEFADAERDYQHADVGTDQEENAEDSEEDISAVRRPEFRRR